MIKPPAISTIHAVLDRNGLVKRKKRRRYKAKGTPLIGAHEPNGLWCADYKGEFMLGNRQYCYPLTISDYRSRYLLTCEGLKSTKSDFAFSIFERAFKDFGLPQAIRTDNGVPFASGNALFGLTRLAVWWLRLGISLQRIKPGHPEQNGRHERMHLTLKKEATKPAAFNFLQQQERFDDFIGVYNNERPHQALGRRLPRRCVYTFSARLRATRRARLPVPRPRHPGHSLWPHLLRPTQDQPLDRLRRPNRGRSTRSTTRSGWSASWSMIWDTSIKKGTGWNPVPQSVRTGQSVNYVSGIRCKPCDRYTPLILWRARRDSNSRPPGSKLEGKFKYLIYIA